jgi:hypothetical protein
MAIVIFFKMWNFCPFILDEQWLQESNEDEFFLMLIVQNIMARLPLLFQMCLSHRMLVICFVVFMLFGRNLGLIQQKNKILRMQECKNFF